MLKLYDYWRSTAAYRVRIALSLKEIPYTRIPVHLVNFGGEHLLPAYLAVNPQGLVPALMLENGQVLTQSLAIIEYMDAVQPEPALYPSDPLLAQRVRQVTNTIGCDLHPLNNLRVLNQLREQFSAGDEDIHRWYHHWLRVGFTGLEPLLSEEGPFALGTQLTAADLCVVPQLYNARRFDFDLNEFPRLLEIEESCLALPAFGGATPDAVRTPEE
jgi:maleylacetoacetate isomerase